MSNIGKRFAKPAEWEQPHFTELNLQQRLFWLFINNRCDLAGVYQLHFPVDTAYLGFTINQEFIDIFTGAINYDAKRVEQLGSRRLWLLSFIRYQQTSKKRNCLSAKAPPHKSIVNKLREHGLLDRAIDNDPELFSEFTREVPENCRLPKGPFKQSEYPNGRVSLDKPKGYSNSSSNSSSNGSGHSSNSSLRSNSKTEELNIYKQVKDEVGDLTLLNSGDLTFEKDVDELLKELTKSDVKDPLNYLIEQIQNTDWVDTLWGEFKESVLAVGETPF